MTSLQFEIQLLASVVAAACALPGVFLVLRKTALMSDAISHSILLGIVLAFFVTGDLSSPFLIFAAAATGILTVVLAESINRTGLVREDAAIGLVFPALFSMGVILISRYAGDVHLDTDAVLLGELAFAPFDRFELFGIDMGPRSLAVMSGILILNFAFIFIYYKELKLATFDPSLAAALGFSPLIINYALMSVVSITAVGAFDAVGSILVVALMVAPAATAYLLTDRLSVMLGLSVGIGITAAIGGYWMAHWLDASIAGSMAVVCGIIFCLVLLFAPQQGLITISRRRMRQKTEFAEAMLAIHLAHHEGRPEEKEESALATLHLHLHWDESYTDRIARRAVSNQLVVSEGNQLILTDKGRRLAEEMMAL